MPGNSRLVEQHHDLVHLLMTDQHHSRKLQQLLQDRVKACTDLVSAADCVQ